MLFDCQLDHHPLVRLQADTPDLARDEYFRRYAIISSVAAWSCAKADPAAPAPVEPDAWVKRRKELGTYDQPAAPVIAPPSIKTDK